MEDGPYQQTDTETAQSSTTSFVTPWRTADADRAKRPSLARPSAPDPELTPGDRVEGLGDFGKPTKEFGTVERANEDDAVVKWDDDGRTRVHQPWLKKV